MRPAERPVKLCLFMIAFVVAAGGAGATPPPGAGYDRSSEASGHQLILRASPAHVQEIAEQHGLSVLAEMTGDDGHLALVSGAGLMSAEQIEALIQGDPRVEGHDRALLAALPGLAEAAAAAPDPGEAAADLIKAGTFSGPCFDQAFTAAPWSGYADQEAARLIGLQAAQLASADCGAATVAIIDTGIDPDHAMMAGALVQGYDFLLEQQGLPSEWDFLDQSVQPILEQSVQPILEQSVQPILEQSVQPILEGGGEAVLGDGSMAPVVDPALAAELAGLELPPYFGHGTMVAGLVRLVAPASTIMPLRVFNGSGRAHLFDIVSAIHYAVDHGADVINMSFSLAESSKELKRAIQYARSHGVVCVAAAGNQGERTQVYPAAYSAATGVAATDLADQLSDFSNYGSALVELAAPGSAVVSTFPGGVYAAGWGTSFSAPLVAGTVALIRSRHPDGDAAAFQALVNDLGQSAMAIQSLAGDIGSGRLDVLGAVLAAED